MTDAHADAVRGPAGAPPTLISEEAKMDEHATRRIDVARVAFDHWRSSAAAPIAWDAERFFDALVETSGLGGEARTGGVPAAIRARFMALVQPHLLGALEQAFFIAGRLSSISAPHVVNESFARIDALLKLDGSGLAIEAVVETFRLPRYARLVLGRCISQRIEEERSRSGAVCTPPVYDVDPLDPAHYAGLVLEHWLADDSLWAPTASNAEQYFGFFTNTSGRYRNPHEGEETSETFDRFMELVGPHLADHLGHARYVAAQLPPTVTVQEFERRLDAIELLLEEDGRRLTVMDLVGTDRLPTFARDVLLRRLAARRAAEAGPADRTDAAAPATASRRDRSGSAAGGNVFLPGARRGPDPGSDSPPDDPKGGPR